jgi:hypothetical protein
MLADENWLCTLIGQKGYGDGKKEHILVEQIFG